MKFTILEVGFLLVLVSWAAACSNEEAAFCPHISSLIFSKLTFVDPGNIDAECSKYSELFTCARQHLGNCSQKSRLTWQPIAMQINDICNESKEAYVKTGSCWSEQEINMEVDLCNDDVKRVDGSKMEMCRALDEFVTCCRVAAKTLCGAEAETVMHNLATTYVSMSKGAVCATTQSPSSTSTTATTTTTTATTTITTITEAQDEALISDTTEATVSLSTIMKSDTALREAHSGCRTSFDCKILSMIVCVLAILIQPGFP
ncbi:uncharacterized protein LOC124278773 [Haliotis rubra]|uniref:uncharacterized protein LOC124278773 n=1 Tax=Haliotis rubra TaxID=36100 RepID=UPI001EE4EC7D|nr:uncharacterized protein LOC124278773 [Haliotis rubra]